MPSTVGPARSLRTYALRAVPHRGYRQISASWRHKRAKAPTALGREAPKSGELIRAPLAVPHSALPIRNLPVFASRLGWQSARCVAVRLIHLTRHERVFMQHRWRQEKLPHPLAK